MPPIVCGLFYKLVVNFLAASDGFRMIARFSLEAKSAVSTWRFGGAKSLFLHRRWCLGADAHPWLSVLKLQER